MTPNDKQESMQKSIDTPSKTRRNLLKASAAAPLVASLSPKSVFAASSITCQGGDFSNVHLETNPSNSNPGNGGGNYGSDNAYRIIVHSWGTNSKKFTDRYFLINQEYYDPFEDGSTPLPDGERPIKPYDELYGHAIRHQNGYPDSFVVANQNEADAVSAIYTEYSKAEMLVFFDQDDYGNIYRKGIFPATYPDDGQSFALTTSCMTSVVMSKVLGNI